MSLGYHYDLRRNAHEVSVSARRSFWNPTGLVVSVSYSGPSQHRRLEDCLSRLSHIRYRSCKSKATIQADLRHIMCM